jgi:hypothetical protein
VAPWKLCQREMTMCLVGWPSSMKCWWASLTAFSVASEPPETNHELFRSPGVNAATRSANSSMGALVKQNDGVNATMQACRAITSAMRARPCPMLFTAEAPPDPSR